MNELPETSKGLGDLIELFLCRYARRRGNKSGRLARDAVLDAVSQAFSSIGEVLYESEGNRFWLESATNVERLKNNV